VQVQDRPLPPLRSSYSRLWRNFIFSSPGGSRFTYISIPNGLTRYHTHFCPHTFPSTPDLSIHPYTHCRAVTFGLRSASAQVPVKDLEIARGIVDARRGRI
jgi:hypothetical protein